MSDSLAINDISGGGKSWPGEEGQMGDTISGEIISVERVQQTSFESGEPLFWSNGDKRMLTKVTLQTELQDSDEDDGVRTLHAKGGNFEANKGEGLAMEKAIVEAAKEAKSSSLDAGGKLSIKLSGLSKPTTRGYQPARLYKAKYEAPTQSVSVDDF